MYGAVLSGSLYKSTMHYVHITISGWGYCGDECCSGWGIVVTSAVVGGAIVVMSAVVGGALW